jgi:hypothetical protein
MSVRIGDLMAFADDERNDAFEPGLAPKRSRKQVQGNKTQAQSAPQAQAQAQAQAPAQAEAQAQKPAGKWTHLPPKLRGELGELDFLRKAMGMGMLVSKPWGDSYRYDFVVDWEGRLSRTQVRSTEYQYWRCYSVHAGVYVRGRAVPLTAKDIDVLVAYIATRDIWYVMPVKAFSPRTFLSFYPDGTRKGGTFEEYREAWWVLMGVKKETKK